MIDQVREVLERRDWELPLPVATDLQNQALVFDDCLRLLPGKRVTLAGRWGNTAVVAKLFLPTALKEQQAEVSGYQALTKASIPTPELLYSGELEAGLSAVIYQKLSPMEPLSAGLRGEKRGAFLTAAFELLASLHQQGIWQEDIHFDNFLLFDGKLHVIDNASLKTQSQPLSAEQSIANLAAFIAQFSWRDRQSVLESPSVALPLTMKSEKARSLLDESSRRVWWKRVEKYLTKVFRNCTEVIVEQRGGWFLASKRGLDPQWLSAFRTAPDSVMVKADMIKDGNSATVARARIGERSVVIKRYNIKSTGHRLRRLFRETRATNAWRAAHLLQMAGIKTPAPLVLLEQRRGPLRGVSYLVTEDAGGEEMLDVYQQREPSAAELEDVQDIFRVMRELQLCHGDFKARNFLVTERGVELIDLDVLHAVASKSRFKHCAEKDRARFLRNWYAHPAMETRFRALLAEPH